MAGPRTTFAAIAVATLLATACSAGSGNDASTAGGALAPDSRMTASVQEGRAGAGTPTTPGPSPSPSPGEMLARHARISLEVADIDAAVARVNSVREDVGGLLLSESIGRGEDGVVPMGANDSTTSRPTSANLVISVPADHLDVALDRLGRIGTVLDRGQGADSVKDAYTDTASRLKTMRASITRLRELMSRADDIAQIVKIESELTSREADLESLQARLASLRNSVERAPVAVSLTTDRSLVDAPDRGFLSGLTAGWAAFRTATAVALTFLGASVPFLVLLVVLTLPALLWRRRRRLAT